MASFNFMHMPINNPTKDAKLMALTIVLLGDGGFYASHIFLNED
jgi:hypothetical protein